ncbi:MAG: hypothetical protein PHZ00_00005 [Candidatus Peribacteraceae bacterium]|nr:hypothetical protein [Candidatus Peribacteraceae bacterium]
MDQHVPAPVSLPGTLWGIAAYFNPVGYRNKLENFRLFRAASKRQGLQLIVVEAALGDTPFELRDDDAEHVIRLRTNAVLWQKERLLNVVLRHLPDACDKVVWLDTDVLFSSDTWVMDLSRKLEEFIVVQPFDSAVQLPRGITEILPPDLCHGESLPAPGTVAWWLSMNRPVHGSMNGHPGYACAARRSLLDRFGFYDKGVVGSGDSIIMGAFFGIDPHANFFIHMDQISLLNHAAVWASPVTAALSGSIGAVEGTVFHLWHGPRQKRYYIDRNKLLAGYVPETDVRIGNGGCFEWCTDKPWMHAKVRDYFWMRDEEGNANFPSVDETRVFDLERQHSMDSAEIQSLRQSLAAAEAVIQHLASSPGPILRRLCTWIDRLSTLILPRQSRLRKMLRALLLRVRIPR